MATNNADEGEGGAAKQEATKEKYTLSLIRPTLEETGLVAYNAAMVRKGAEMELDGLTTEAMAPTDVACRVGQFIFM